MSKNQYKGNYHIPHEVATLFYDISFYEASGVDNESQRIERENNCLAR